MKTHIFTKSKSYLCTAFQVFLEPARQWLFSTPERALDHAYGAALMIKSLEHEYIKGNKSSRTSADRRDCMRATAQENFGEFLSIIQLRLAEFKASHSILGTPNSTCAETLKRINTNVEKLQMIDEVLGQYSFEQSFPSSVPPFFRRRETVQRPVNHQSYSVTIDVKATKIPY
jgi:hypothetical protein